MEKLEKQCEWCQKLCTNKRFCSFACKNRFWNRFLDHTAIARKAAEKNRKPRVTVMLACEKCGSKFAFTTTDTSNEKFKVDGYPKRFCSVHCSHARTFNQATRSQISCTLKARPDAHAPRGPKDKCARASWDPKHVNVQVTCAKCGAPFTKRWNSQKKFCSVACAAWNDGKGGVRHQLTKICECCQRTFNITPRGTRRFCSAICAKKCHGQICSVAKLRWFASGKGKVTGGKTKWIAYGNINVQGTFELRACKIFDAWKSLGKIVDWMYAHDRISYQHADGSYHIYVIDFTIINNDLSRRYVEVKGWIRPHDEEKWTAVKALGMQFEVWFKDDLERHENELPRIRARVVQEAARVV